MVNKKNIIEWEDKPYTDARGWLVIDSLANGVCGGGIFIHENCTLTEVADIANDMTYKNLLNPIPFGGAKAGIKYAPDKKDVLDVLTRFLMFNKELLTNTWCTSADLNTNHAAIVEIVKKNLNLPSPFYSLGEMYAKKLGIPNQSEHMEQLLEEPVNEYFDLVGSATGYTLAAVMSQLAKGEQIKLVVQGFGTIGSSLAYYAQNYFNIKVVGISDLSGCLINENGIDTNIILARRKKNPHASLESIIDGGKWHKNKFKNEQEFLSFFLKNTQADCFSPCASRYSVTADIIRDMVNYCFAESSKKFLLCGGNTVLAHKDLVNYFSAEGILYLPTWFTSSGNSLLFGYLLSHIDNEKPLDTIKNISNYTIELLVNAQLKYHADPYTALYLRHNDAMNQITKISS